MSGTNNNAARKRILPQVLEYMHQRPGQEVWAKDIASDLNLDVDQVRNCFSNGLRNGTMPGVEVLVRATSWKYLPPDESSKAKGRLLEVLAETKSGRLVLQDEDGLIYTADRIA